MTTAGPQTVRLDVDAFGHGTCAIGELDLSSKLSRVTIDSRGGEPTKVYLELVKGSSVSAELEALVGFHDNPDLSILDFLQNVDVVALEAAAMERLNGLDGSIQSPMAAAVVVLQEWAAAGVDDNRA